MQESNLPIIQEQIAEIIVDHISRNHSDTVVDSKTTTAELPEVEAAHKWLKIGDKDVPISLQLLKGV